MKTCILIFGSYINCYNIMRELYSDGVRDDMIVFDFQDRCVTKSNMVKKFVHIERDDKYILILQMMILKQDYDYIIVFPTDELHIKMLCDIKDEIKDFCFLPFADDFFSNWSKYDQYESCLRLGVPCPETTLLVEHFPYYSYSNGAAIIKPNKRYDIDIGSILFSFHPLFRHGRYAIESLLQQDYEFVASEIIPGDDTNIWAYTCYRSKRTGKIENEWTGRKISQHPGSYGGTFASAESSINETVAALGRKLIKGMNLYGIIEPEFKYDSRDNKYKLIEINFRAMMWHRVGYLAGVHLLYTQYLDALGINPPRYSQSKKPVRLCYMKYEILNLFNRRNYLKTFLKNVFGRIHFCVFNIRDLKPFMADTMVFFRMLFGKEKT